MESLVNTAVEQVDQVFDVTKSSLAQFGALVQQGWAETNAQLAAQEDGSLRKSLSGDRSSEHPGEDLLSPAPSGSDGSSESVGDAVPDPI
jgi:hypothetical protein